MTDALSTLARADAARLKSFAETLVPEFAEIEVLQSRSGLVMLPIRDTAKGVAFHLGEVLMSEAHIRSGDAQGYGMRKGHDLEASMAMALVDLALTQGIAAERCQAFCENEAAALSQRDIETLRRVEATRVDMETF
ncbi:putative phosphonate metabolism protein PhnG [Candidatus Rhodobacter oscarellae]|uniref:Putative phosphonate metabolism protein PhnG n=1 Tax=Candidatus Rhodobacter oscarellae TaxID=1675527 RepID=A0A0J9E4T4_9RHOB|nr:phosphonate C-P lyase system protein PhnG [Candidatus Rhodobacter lobularis]KMW57757.1 putative phosphonate metabolism protein PhnG [Candidatus Rhodobacter lobularis]